MQSPDEEPTAQSTCAIITDEVDEQYFAPVAATAKPSCVPCAHPIANEHKAVVTVATVLPSQRLADEAIREQPSQGTASLLTPEPEAGAHELGAPASMIHALAGQRNVAFSLNMSPEIVHADIAPACEDDVHTASATERDELEEEPAAPVVAHDRALSPSMGKDKRTEFKRNERRARPSRQTTSTAEAAEAAMTTPRINPRPPSPYPFRHRRPPSPYPFLHRRALEESVLDVQARSFPPQLPSFPEEPEITSARSGWGTASAMAGEPKEFDHDIADWEEPPFEHTCYRRRAHDSADGSDDERESASRAPDHTDACRACRFEKQHGGNTCFSFAREMKCIVL